MSEVDTRRFERLDGGPPERTVRKLSGFKLGDLVSCYHCEDGRTYMPGVGEIVRINPDEDYPFVCEHNKKYYTFKAVEIEEHDFY